MSYNIFTINIHLLFVTNTIHALQIIADLEVKVRRRKEKLASFGLTFQAFIIAIGPTVIDFMSFYVLINDVTYEVSCLVGAVDLCFKAFYALNAKYPPECEVVWNFLQRFVYSIRDKTVTCNMCYIGVTDFAFIMYYKA